MGLAASQARLLTITARKSDCEFQSMRYSHQKIALSRNMTDISNEYQNSLNQTKLVYDYYGTGDASNPLTYGLMMTPSELNGHMPILTTDSAGKVVLNSQYAAAAEAAGIPKEGLGCLPSTTVRNNFLEGLYGAGLITEEAKNTYQEIMYSQGIGLGNTDLVTTTVEEMTLKEMLEAYKGNSSQTLYSLTSVTKEESSDYGTDTSLYKEIQEKLDKVEGDTCDLDAFRFVQKSNNNVDSDLTSYSGNLSITDILDENNSFQILAYTEKTDDLTNPNNENLEPLREAINSSSIWTWMFQELANMLNVTGDSQISNAIAYAEAMTKQILEGGWATVFDGSAGGNGKLQMPYGGVKYLSAMDQTPEKEDTSDGGNKQVSNEKYIGYIGTHKEALSDGGVAINVSNIARAFLTYYAQAMEGGTKASNYDIKTDNYDARTVAASKMIDEDFKFNVLVEQGVNTHQSLNSGFYDAMFNQICLKGWVENSKVDDKNYLQEMFQNGLLFISTCSDDGHYYQGNYSTNSFIKEVVDEEAIARAEAKYNVEKQKINSKEEVLDMKMKNLDTEISALTTEYDTIKSVISKNIQKSFKRYEA